jgi:patatin-like phospholipase/acyl hydrolase
MSYIFNYFYKQTPIKILSINGGGIKGLYSLYLLKELSEGKKIGDYFDIICGTSVGSIIAICIALELSIDEIIKIFETFIFSIFDSKANKNTWSLDDIIVSTEECWHQLLGSKYNVIKLSEAIIKITGNKKMGELKKTVYIPSYCVSKNKIVIFSNKTHPDYLLSDVLLASTAAPTYFPMHKINEDLYIDGGLWANNPSLIGLIEALKNKTTNQKCSVFSVGNINTLCKIKPSGNNTLNFTFLENIINLIFLANEQATQNYTRQIADLNNCCYMFVDGTHDFKDLSECPIQIDDSYTDIIQKLKLFGECKGKELFLNDKIKQFFFH